MYHSSISFRLVYSMHINGHKLVNLNLEASSSMLPWLTCRTPLTDKLQAEQGSADLILLNQGWTLSDFWARLVLGLGEQAIYQREIMMRSQGIDFWYARTLIPSFSFQMAPDYFKRLETESVRNLIFGSEPVIRSEIMYYPVDKSCLEYQWLKKHKPSFDGLIWVRYSELVFEEKANFYLLELLLPELENC